MNYNCLLKKLAAGATTVAMLASLGVTAFAAPDNKVANSGITITDATATYSLNGTAKNYTITLAYTGVDAENAQVSVLGYVFGDDETQWDIEPGDSAIKAVDQDANSAYNGTITIKLADGVREVNDQTVLAVKVGSDDADVQTAQAVIINLADATEAANPVLLTGIDAITGSVAYGTTKADLIGALKDDYPTVPAKGNEIKKDDNSVVEEGVDATVTVDWDNATFTAGLTDDVVTGNVTVSAPVTVDGVKVLNTNNLTVSASLTATATSIAYPVATTISIPVGTDDVVAEIQKGKIGLALTADGEAVDYISLENATVTVSEEFSTETASDEPTGTADIIVSGESVSKYFDVTGLTVTVNLKVVEEVAVLYGDVNNDGSVNAKDTATLMRHIGNWTGYETLASPEAADVNVDGSINAKDTAILKRHIGTWAGYDTLPIK